MATPATIKVTAKFEDDSKKTVSIGEIDATQINETKIRNQVALLNNATQREESYPGFTTGFTSNDGANFNSITSVQIVVSRRTVIF